MDEEDYKKFNEFTSQLALPFQETFQEFLKPIFKILEERFGLQKDSDQNFLDLGAGDGRVVIFVGFHYNIKSVGIEINQNLIDEANESLNRLKKQYAQKSYDHIQFKHGDLYEYDLSMYDFIYVFSLPTMQKSMKHILKTAKRGAIIIAHKYPLTVCKSLLIQKYKLKHKAKQKPIYTYFYRVDEKQKNE
ncbi:MAG: class I SAM-dependent methyltransferase [Promethearchaeia archaeon]